MILNRTCLSFFTDKDTQFRARNHEATRMVVPRKGIVIQEIGHRTGGKIFD